MSGMLLLLKRGGRLMYIIPLPVTVFSPGGCGPWRHLRGFSSYHGCRGTNHYIFWGCSKELIHPLVSFIFNIRKYCFELRHT